MAETPIFDALHQSQPLPRLDDATNRAAADLTRTLEELASLGLRGLSHAHEEERADDERPNATVTPLPRQAEPDQEPADTQTHAVAAS